MHRTILVLAFVCQIGCSSSSVDDTAPLDILILPHSAQIGEGELLVCKVTLRNRGSDPIIFERPPSDEIGSLIWEVRKQGERNFSRIKTPWTGTNGCMYWPELSVPAGESYVTFDGLSPFENSQPFVNAGVYEVRAAFDLAGKKIVSRPAEISVTPNLPSERQAVASASEFLGGVLLFMTPDCERLTERERQLSSSQLKTTYQWLLAFLAAETADDADARAQAAISQAELRKQVPPVIAQALELKVIERLIGLNKWSAANRLLEQITTPSFDRDQLKLRLLNHSPRANEK